MICSRPNSKEGLELMNIVENKAKEDKNNVIYLYALNEKKLISWYESQDYKIIDSIFDENDGKIKVFRMEKVLNF